MDLDADMNSDTDMNSDVDVKKNGLNIKAY